MPLTEILLATNIEDAIFAQLQAQNGVTEKGAELGNFSKAVAKGVVMSLVNSVGLADGLLTLMTAAGPGFGIFGVNQVVLSNKIKTYANQAFGSDGEAMKSFCDGLASAIVTELANATLTPTGGLGGNVTTITGWTYQSMALQISNATGWEPNPDSMKFFEAISKAITEEIQTNGYGFIPVSLPLGGAPLVTIS